MSQWPHNLDSEARAELLCYLVVSQLTARALTGAWLTVDNLVESMQIWLRANGGSTNWQDRLALAHAAEELAPRVAIDFPPDERGIAALFGVDRWQLDYRSPVFQSVYRACVAHLPR